MTALRNIPVTAIERKHSIFWLCLGCVRMLPPNVDESEDRFGLSKLPLLLRVEDLTRALSVGRTHFYTTLLPQLDVVKLGRATRITRESVIRLVARSLTGPTPGGNHPKRDR